jgi:hypothetical protein
MIILIVTAPAAITLAVLVPFALRYRIPVTTRREADALAAEARSKMTGARQRPGKLAAMP